MNSTVDRPPMESGWVRRNGPWLAAATILGALAFYLPWCINERELDRTAPRHALIAAPGSWSEYEGAGWRLVGVRTEKAGAGGAADYQHPDATVLLLDYEVVPGPSIDTRRLDQCHGRLVDGRGHEWAADNPPKLATRLARRGISASCGSRVVGEPGTAVAGKPFEFTHAFLVPTGTRLSDLHADIYFPPSTTRPTMGTYLRFALATPAP